MSTDQRDFMSAVEERLARTTDPRHRSNLETVLAHSKTELAGDIHGVLATLTQDPEYRFWSEGRDVGPKGRDEVTAFYTTLFSTGSYDIDAPIDRLVVDDDTVVTEIIVKQAMPGSSARANGYEVADDRAFHLIEFRAVVLWRFTPDGKLAGEDTYMSRNLADIRKLDASEVPEALRNVFDANGNASYVFT